MFHVKETPKAIRIELSSKVDHIQNVIWETWAFLENRGYGPFLELNIVLRELLRNAIEHGNLNIDSRRVVVTIEMAAGPLCRITVEDEGEGFAHERLGLPVEDPRHERRRGLVLIRELAERLEFNPKGNRAIVLLRPGGSDAGGNGR
ncbi:MAG: ATP-binding protein [Desulfobacteraceae bacterium]|nr:ATP-binding protein [Desulfobacteraceae bacterium]